MDSIELYVREIINKYIALPVPIASIESDEDLNIYGFDELNIVVISVDLEKKYNILIDENIIIGRNLKTIKDFCDYVKDHL